MATVSEEEASLLNKLTPSSQCRCPNSIWGWPDYEFSVNNDNSSFMNVDVDLEVNMPCRCKGYQGFGHCFLMITFVDISVNLRDAIGDYFCLSGSGLKCDGVS